METRNDARPFARTRLSRRDWLAFAAKGASPYNTRGQRNTINTTDGIYNSLSSTQKSALTLRASQSGDGYAGTINLGVQVG
jgi:hypothetical protein